MTDSAPYIDAWLQHEPEMELALTFAPRADRRGLSMWGALLHQLCAATLEIGELQVAQTKLVWWQQELERGRNGSAAHPLVRDLFMLEPARVVRADRWQRLAGSALALASSDLVASDTHDLLASRHAFAHAIASVEADLFAAGSAANSPDISAPNISAIQRNLVMRQMRASAVGACWPLQLRARLQLGPDPEDAVGRAALAAALAGELRDSPESIPGAVLFRRLRCAIDQWQLRQLRISGTFVSRPSPRLAWTLWRAARAKA